MPGETGIGEAKGRHMPTLFRFVVIAVTLAGAGYWALFMLATRFEPQQQETVQQIGTVKIRKQ
jgi:hypothetical protein